MRFAREATRWPCIWLGSALTLQELAKEDWQNQEGRGQDPAYSEPV